MSSIRVVSFIFLLVFFVTPVTVAMADKNVDDSDIYLEDKDFKGKTKWQEQGLILPDYPKKKNLIEFRVSHMRYKFYIDKKSIAIGKKDGVVRYTVVIKSASGANNIFYEGIRCQTKEYKQYAYANVNKQEFKSMTRSSWRQINGLGVNRYRRVLQEVFVCRADLPRDKVKEVVQALKYPPENHAPEDPD